MNTPTNLIKGYRYLFYLQKNSTEKEIFRGNFVACYSETMVINTAETERNPNTLVSFPLEWINKIETLEDITRGKAILPSDILLIIDEYV